MTTIELDGATGEGGGQILRTALALSMCTGQPLVLRNIRANRPKAGLMRQHLACVRAATAICSAQVEGDALNSTALRFTPGPVRAGTYEFNVGSAGSCTLVLQTIWPALMLADGPSNLMLKGGTHNPLAPSFHVLALGFAPLMRRLGAPAELTLHRHGFYPAGGGSFQASIAGATNALRPFDLMTRGEPTEQYALCVNAGIPFSVVEREFRALQDELGWSEAQMRVGRIPAHEGPGNALMAVLPSTELCEVFTSFGAKGVTSEQVARALAQEVRAYQASNAALGPFLADQWALPLAIAVHQSGIAASYTCTDITLHARTNFEVIERFLPVTFRTAPQASGHHVHVQPA